MSNNVNLAEITIAAMVEFFTITFFFIFCEFGSMMTYQFDTFNDDFNRCNWYLFPIKMQRMMVICIECIQQPPIIQGYANTVLTRDAFKQVGFLASHESKSDEQEAVYKTNDFD